MSYKYIFPILLVVLSLINIVFFYRVLKKRKYSLFIFLMIFMISSVVCGIFFYPQFRSIYRKARSGIVRYDHDCSCTSAQFNLPKVDYYRVLLPLLNRRFPDIYLHDDAILNRLVRRGKLIPVRSDTGYIINPLRNSSAHLHPKGYALLKELGFRFHQELQRNGIPSGFFRVHSVSRTVAQQEIIRRNNPLTASRSKSAHSYGVAIDISAVRVSGNRCSEGLDCLERVLRAMHREGKLLLTPESTNLHVTFIPR